MPRACLERNEGGLGEKHLEDFDKSVKNMFNL